MPPLRIARLFAPEEGRAGEETFHPLLKGKGFVLEHIVSRGAASPEESWYDQPGDEWVLLARGAAELEFADGTCLALAAGDHLTIPARCRHRVTSTSPDAVWLALHMQP